MATDVRWQRAALLFGQQRWDLAARELQALLAEQPEHAGAHALLARTLAQTDALDEALASARQAVALAPDADYAFASLAVVHLQRDELDAAATANERAIELDPDDVDHRSTRAQIRLLQRRWADALAAADEGLALDPQDTDCLNLRAIALTRLGRGAEATDSVDASLARDPDNPYTHQARGFALLQRGDAKGALHHFQQALRRDPTLDGARAGLVEALKARNPLYRVVLRWFLWLGRFSGGNQVAIVLGVWFASRLASGALAAGGHEVAATVVSYAWLGFVLLTACTVPLFNLLLLLHPLGRHALERTARNDALLLGGAVLALGGVGVHAWLGDDAWSKRGWLFWLVFLLPVAGIGLFHAGWARRVLQAFCVAALGFWVWWSVRLEQLLAAVADAAPTTVHRDRVDAELAELLAPVRAHAALFGTLVLAVALSTWFVMLAPKGRPRRRRR
jgi:Flp pilus assembly protein TadD